MNVCVCLLNMNWCQVINHGSQSQFTLLYSIRFCLIREKTTVFNYSTRPYHLKNIKLLINYVLVNKNVEYHMIYDVLATRISLLPWHLDNKPEKILRILIF